MRPTRNPVDLAGARPRPARRTLRDAARDPADDRRLPRSDAAHELRRDEPRRRRPARSPDVVATRRRLPRRLGPRRRQLADRHQPGDVGDDAVDRGARRGRAADVVARRRRARDAARAGCSASSIASSIPTRTPRRAAGRGPISPAACPTPTTRRARCSRWRICGSAGRDDARVRDAAAAGVALAARSAEPRRRHADVLPRLDRPAVRPQRPGSDRARGARVVRVAAAPGEPGRDRASAPRARQRPAATSPASSTATARSRRCGSATRRRPAR